MPAGLVYSAIIAAISLGCLTLVGGLGTQGGRGPQPLVHTAAALCLLWSGLAYVLACRADVGTRAREDLVSVLQIASIVMGVLAAIILVYAATIELLLRTRYFDYDLPRHVVIWATGTLDIGLLVVGVVLHWRRTGHGNLMTAAFWLVVLGGLWLSFIRPAARHIGAPGAGYQVPGDWASWFALAGALTIGAFTTLQGVLADRRRRNAWPASLGHLTTPLPVWPGFDLSAGIVGALILIVGCAHVLLFSTAISGLVAGAALLTLVGRRWNENLADAGLALITLGVVSLCMLGFDEPVWSSGYPSILNRAIFGLAVMTWLWHWLARVWVQQLDDGRAWTTAGRLIRTSRRVGFLIACTGVLLSLQLMLWPLYPDVLGQDNAPGRWVAALCAYGLLVLALLSAMRGTRRSTLGWLALQTVASAVGFCLVRAPDAPLSGWVLLHWPVAMAIAAGVCLLAAWAISHASSWTALREALVYTGVLVAPMAAIAGVTLTDAALLGRVPLWIPAGTFAVLAVVYAIAALHPGPPTFVTVTVLCAVMSIWHVRGDHLLPSPYFYALLSGLCMALISVVYQGHGRPAFMRTVKWLGVGLAVLSLAAGLLLGR